MDADNAAHDIAVDAVLFSADLFTALWPWLDRASKQALRCVNGAMRGQVDASIVVVTSPSSEFSAPQLIHALSKWPGVRDLTLLAVNDDEDLVPLGTSSLAGLTSLTLRQAPPPHVGAEVAALDMTLSNTVEATLHVIDISGCHTLSSLDFVGSCEQLRCLWMPGCVSVSELSPLAACSETLEELWMAADFRVRNLAPLKACTKLHKLDLRGCRPALRNQVEDLQLACTKLADPTSIELECLVHDLQPTIQPVIQANAAMALIDMRDAPGALTAIAAAGAITPLVQLLGHRTPPHLAAVGSSSRTALYVRQPCSEPGRNHRRWRHSGSGEAAGT
ncbi:hypothetical protein FOA52_002149 [Chlamydomonas sp. UWO 241]|nr:hypothetical protein FOA52_002149 [Chlamydomonas sp. UWO 241]